MTRKRILEDPVLLTVIGPVLYLVVWFIVLPIVADTSTRLAVLTLTLITGLYCYSIAHIKRLNAPVWTAFGVLAGFMELGFVPVILVSLIRSKQREVDTPDQAQSK